MAGGFQKPVDPIAQLSEQINDMLNRLRELEQRTVRVRVVNADPPETDPVNAWIFTDGRIRVRYLNPAGNAFVYKEVSLSSTIGGDASASAAAAATVAPTTREGSWTAQWSQSYRQSGAARTDAGTTRLYYGSSGDSFNGRSRSLVGFDYAAIAASLAGSTVTSATLTMTNIHSWYNAGSDVHFGIHDFSSEPGSWAGGGIPRSMITKYTFKPNQTRTVALPLDFAVAIRDGWGKGVAIESPSDSRTFYGYASGVGDGEGAPPILTVKYDK